MINIKLKNKHMYYCISDCFNSLDPRFITHLWNLTVENEDDDFEQTVEIPKTELVKIYMSVSRNMEGVAASINKEINEILLPQLMIGYNISEEVLGLLNWYVDLQSNGLDYDRTIITSDEETDETNLTDEQKKLKNIKELILSNEGVYVLHGIMTNNYRNHELKLDKIKHGKRLLLTPY